MTLTKKIKTIIWAIAGAIVVLNGILCGTLGAKNRNIKAYKATIAEQEQTIEEQKELIVKLAGMEAVHCEVSVTVKNTAIMGSTKSGEISQDAKQIATYLRGEVLEALEETHNANATTTDKKKNPGKKTQKQ